MMSSRKDNLYTIRMRGSISSVKPRWWESNTFRLSSKRYALLCFLLMEVKVPWRICWRKCFANMLLNTDIWWSFSMVEFMKVSFQERTQESGVGAQGKPKLRNFVQGHCAQGVLKLLKIYIAATVDSPEATRALLLPRLFSALYNSNQFQSWKNQHHCQESRVVLLWDNHICWIVLWWKASKSLCFLWSLS